MRVERCGDGRVVGCGREVRGAVACQVDDVCTSVGWVWVWRWGAWHGPAGLAADAGDRQGYWGPASRSALDGEIASDKEEPLGLQSCASAWDRPEVRPRQPRDAVNRAADGRAVACLRAATVSGALPAGARQPNQRPSTNRRLTGRFGFAPVRQTRVIESPATAGSRGLRHRISPSSSRHGRSCPPPHGLPAVVRLGDSIRLLALASFRALRVRPTVLKRQWGSSRRMGHLAGSHVGQGPVQTGADRTVAELG